jgi:NLI interacting factor-like phosphatase
MRVFLCFALAFFLRSTLAADARTMVLPVLPDWAKDTLYSGLYLDIDKVMATEHLTRFQAVELQNRMRDRGEKGVDLPSSYEAALKEIRAGRLESGFQPVTFESPADFILVLDMDETMMMQWQKNGATFFDLSDILPDVVGNARSGPYVKFTPHAEEFILRMLRHPHCKSVTLFSAKQDAAALDLFLKWKFSDGKPVRHVVNGTFHRNHLIVGPKTLKPSKDLRIFDESLKHVVILDDNPSRILQPELLRAQPKFDADVYQKAIGDSQEFVKRHYESVLANAADEFEETAAAAEHMKIPYSQAFLPYAYSGARIFQSLTKTLGNAEEARRLTRLHPEFQDATFYSFQ